MKNMKCLFYMMMGAGVALIYKKYEEEINCMCKKIMKKEKEIIEDGLELE